MSLRARTALTPVSALALVLLVSGLLAGCTTVGKVHAADTVELSLELLPGTPARVETFNGAIEVSTTDGAAVSASVSRSGEGSDQAAAEADRDSIEVTLELMDGVALLRAVYTPSPDSVSGDRGASIQLVVPSSTPLELWTSNGSITVRDTSGGVSARTSNGPVELRDLGGSLAVDSSNGAVTVTTDEPVAVDLHTSNGFVRFDGLLQPGEARFETSNGGVELALPADAAFALDASTTNGKVTSELVISGSVTDSAVEGVVGSPQDAEATTVVVRASNGPITLTER